MFDAEQETLNPARSQRVLRAKKTLEKLMGKGRKHETPALLQAHVKTMLGEVRASRAAYLSQAEFVEASRAQVAHTHEREHE